MFRALAGIGGNNQDPRNWGPPNLTFSSGISGLGDANSAFNRNRTDAMNVNVSTNYRRHNFIFGGDFRRQEFNEFCATESARQICIYRSGDAAGRQLPPARSTTTGSDVADFLLGIPDTSAISFGNPDKYFRQSVYDLYFTDDWRLLPELSINAGVRWDYGAPLTELFGRLANIDVSPGFSNMAPVIANSSQRAGKRASVSDFIGAAGQKWYWTADRNFVASDSSVNAGGESRIWNLLRYIGLSDGDGERWRRRLRSRPA